jgi:hypothetical protein
VPTHAETDSFLRDYRALSPVDKRRFQAALKRFIADLRKGTTSFRPGLRVKRVKGRGGVWEMTWAPDGRATFQYGKPVVPGKAHVTWRRLGDHSILG